MAAGGGEKTPQASECLSRERAHAHTEQKQAGRFNANGMDINQNWNKLYKNQFWNDVFECAVCAHNLSIMLKKDT